MNKRKAALEAKKKQFITVFQEAGFLVQRSSIEGNRIVFRVGKHSEASKGSAGAQKQQEVM